MSSLGTSNARPIREEIINLTAILADTQARLQHVAARLEHDGTRAWQERFEEQDRLYKEAVNSSKWLRSQNIELEQRLEAHKPEMNNALSARDTAFRKLKHARKVIRDLLTERGDMSSPSTLTQEDIDAALDERAEHHDSSSPSSQSDRTVRLHVNSPSVQTDGRAFGGSSTATLPLSGVKGLPSTFSGIGPPKTRSPQSKSLGSTHLSSPRAGPSRLFPSSLTRVASQSQSPTSNRTSSPEPWRLHFKNPPGVSDLQEGPISWNRLQSSLKLDDDTYKSLLSFPSSTDLRVKLVIVHYEKATIACLYDPILIDLPGRSCLLDWGYPKLNQNAKDYIASHRTADTTFHTFFFPISEAQDSWYYIGGLEWTPATNVPEFWTTLEEGSRKKILKKLARRTNGAIQEEEMERRLDNGDLQQFCIELTASKGRVSQDFATEVLGRQASPSSSTTPSRPERRTGALNG